jgi:putative oxidoreductase
MKNKILHYFPLNTDAAILFLRLIFGGMFVYYGYTKVISYDQILPVFGDPIGIGTKTSLILVIFAELVCGFFVLIGFLTRITIIPILITMIVAYFVVHAKDPFMVKQPAFLYLLLSLVIFLFGSGRYSVDYLIFGNKPRVPVQRR